MVALRVLFAENSLSFFELQSFNVTEIQDNYQKKKKTNKQFFSK